MTVIQMPEGAQPEQACARQPWDGLAVQDIQDCLIVGYYGAGNFGDELLLEVLLSRMRSAGVRRARFLYQSPPRYRMHHHDFGYDIVDARRPYAMLRAMLAARCVVVGGGGLWGRDITWRGLVLGIGIFAARRLLRKPVYLLGVGYYGSTGPLGHLSARLAAAGATLILARDAETYANFRRFTRHVRSNSDLAHCVRDADLAPYEREAVDFSARIHIAPGGPPAVLVGLRRFRPDAGTRYLRAVEELVRRYPDRHFILAAFQPGGLGAAEESAAAHLERHHHNVSRVDLAVNPLAFCAWLRWRRQRLVVIAPQYHALLTAALNGIPLFPMAYDNKVEQLLGELHYPDTYSFYDVRADQLAGFLDPRAPRRPPPAGAPPARRTAGQRALMRAIGLARHALANTPVQRLRAVGWLYRRIVLSAWGGGALTVDFRGLRLAVQGGNHVFIAGLLGGFYESIELDLMERLAARSRTVLDVGANIGTHACVAATHLPPDGQLVAFEPVPANVAYLQGNLERNGLAGRVRVEQVAVGEVPGEQTMHLADQPGNHSLSAEVAGAGGGTTPVRVTSLDAYLAGARVAGPVDLLKVDIEGYDGYALRGATRLLAEDRPTLMAEFVPCHLTRAGFSPAEYLDLIFAAYPRVFVIDEPRRRLYRCDRHDLDRYADRPVNLNLVATARPEHADVIEAMSRA